MDSLAVRPARLRIAIVLSIVLHLCACAMLTYLAERAGSSKTPASDDVELYALASVMRIASPMRVAAPPHATARRTAAPVQRPLPVAARMTRQSKVLRTPKWTRRSSSAAAAAAVPTFLANGSLTDSGALVARTFLAHRAGDSSRLTRLRFGGREAQRSVLALTALAPTPTPTPAPPSSPTPAAAASPTPRPSATPGFGGLFSQNYPPALTTPTLVESIQSRLGIHGRIRVDIDEAGHATGVHFIDIISPQAQVEVRAQLLAASYVPADCNGLQCSGSLEISY